MPIIVADFRSDLIAWARRQLTEDWGSTADNLTDDDVLLAFLDARRRRPSAKPRKIWLADDFTCPPELAAGWQALQDEVTQGKELWPRMSRRHLRLDNLDGMLNEWNVHHFHLGTTMTNDDSGLVARTGPLVFARVTDPDFFAISVDAHQNWENLTILESLHRNWPDSIRQYRLNGITGEPLTEEQRRNLRSKNLNVATAVADGTVYINIGGGVMSSGAAARARTDTDMLMADIENLLPAIEQSFPILLPHLVTHGYDGESELHAVLTNITSQGFQVEFPAYEVGFNVTLEGGWYHRPRPS